MLCRQSAPDLPPFLLVRRLLFLLLIMVSTATTAQVTAPASEEIVLDDAEKRIVETEYRAARAISAHGPEAGGWEVDAGAVIKARRIDLTLRNVRGVVRFSVNSNALSEVFARSERRRLARAGVTP